MKKQSREDLISSRAFHRERLKDRLLEITKTGIRKETQNSVCVSIIKLKCNQFRPLKIIKLILFLGPKMWNQNKGPRGSQAPNLEEAITYRVKSNMPNSALETRQTMTENSLRQQVCWLHGLLVLGPLQGAPPSQAFPGGSPGLS